MSVKYRQHRAALKHSDPPAAPRSGISETPSPLHWLCYLSKTTSGLWKTSPPEKRAKVPGRMERGASNEDEKQMEKEQRIL